MVRLDDHGNAALQHLYYGARSPDQDLVLPIVHHGSCDASAASALGRNMFFVGNGEDNVLRLYHSFMPGNPVYEQDISVDLGLERGEDEADIEAAAQLGGRCFWITSHGRSEKGKLRPARHRFFATTSRIANDGVEIALVGMPGKSARTWMMTRRNSSEARSCKRR